MEDTIIVDAEWLDARFFRPAKNGRYRVILDGWEKRATYRDGKWSRDIEAFKSAEYERIK